MSISDMGQRLRGLFGGRSSRKSRGSRGTAELSVVVVAASLVLGVLFGDGLSRTSVNLGDGLSWLKDEPTGEVIQVNPATGRPEARIGVGDPGDSLDIAQYDGRLVVINRSTGELISFDLATLLASGQRSITGGDATDILLHEGKVFVLDRAEGSLAAIDPVTTDILGEVWISEPGIVDGQVDGTGRVWILDDTGLVTGLDWSDQASAFVSEGTRQVKGSGPSSVLVGHDTGVTLFGPDNGIVVQIGTDADIVATAPSLRGQVLQPDSSPAHIVPVAAPQTSSIVIVGDSQVREVGLGPVGCAEPGRPVVFHEVVYVPCIKAGKAIRLHPDGSVAGGDILLPEGDGEVEFVVDEGHLLINVQGADRGVQVLPDGSTRTFLRQDPTVPVQPVRSVGNQPVGGAQATVPDIPDLVSQNRRDGSERTPPRQAPPGEDTVLDPPDAPQDPGTRNPGNQGPDDSGNLDTGGTVDCTVDPTAEGCDDAGNGPGDGTGGDTGEDPDCEADPTAEGCEEAVEPLTAPTSVVATLQGDGSVTITWAHSGPAPTDFTVRIDGGAVVSTVAPGVRQVVVTSVPAGVPSRFVVTARRAAESRASAPSNAVTPAVAEPISAPTGVSATVQANGSVQVNWSYTGATPEDFTIRIDGGSTLATVNGGARQAVVTGVPTGTPSRFVVTARRGGDTMASAPSNQVTPASRPGAPGSASATSSFTASGTTQTVTVAVDWTAAPANGSPVTSYAVTVAGPNGTRTFTTNGSGRSGTATWTCDWGADPGCGLSSGTYTVSVKATNDQGEGPAATTSTSQDVTTTALPTPNQPIATDAQTGFLGIEGWGSTTIVMAPPSDWRNFDGVCRYQHTGNMGMDGRPVPDSGTVPCSATSLELSIQHGIIRGGPDPYTGGTTTLSHQITFTATNANGTVTSQTFAWQETQQMLCQQCQIP
ncbi:hypothetical protein [Nocardioides sp. AE5]|uniref:hypothetical protein n=1 Tax=Nocardioides sp. AE5 TaxID=2962573 RepID=UPI002881EA81|nr:hypothetical protein [Nocardioides sp. AE5]MDT0202778.1 hypothetical protein [Nocardioides sp. AE5]